MNTPEDWSWLDFFLLADLDAVSPEIWRNAKEKAKQWRTCAVGEICPELPTTDSAYGNGRPVDNLLAEYGGDFFRAIVDTDAKGAYGVYQEIQRRAEELREANRNESCATC